MSRLTNQNILKLAFKSIFATLSLLVVALSGVSFWSLIFALVVFLIIYFLQTSERSMLRASFWFLPIIFLFVLYFIQNTVNESFPYVSVLILSLFLHAILLFILFCIDAFLFKDRFFVYGLFQTVLFFLFFLVCVQLTINSSFWLFFMIFCVVILIRESFLFFGVPFKQRIFVQSLVVGFLVTEIAVVSRFLPLGALNNAAFLTLISLILRDVLVFNFQGILDKKFVFREISIFALFTLVIFIFSKWWI